MQVLVPLLCRFLTENGTHQNMTLGQTLSCSNLRTKELVLTLAFQDISRERESTTAEETGCTCMQKIAIEKISLSMKCVSENNYSTNIKWWYFTSEDDKGITVCWYQFLCVCSNRANMKIFHFTLTAFPLFVVRHRFKWPR